MRAFRRAAAGALLILGAGCGGDETIGNAATSIVIGMPAGEYNILRDVCAEESSKSMSFFDKLRREKFLSFTLILFTLSVGIVIGTLINSGSIAGGANYGIALSAGGLVINAASASISGGANHGIAVYNSAGTVVNSGSIVGVVLSAGGRDANPRSTDRTRAGP